MTGPPVHRVHRNEKALLSVVLAAQGTHTHVRLGTGHSGDPHLPGQHCGDVEVCDVHVPCERRGHRECQTPFSPAAHRASHLKYLGADFVHSFLLSLLKKMFFYIGV